MSSQQGRLLQDYAHCLFTGRLRSQQRVFIDAENRLAIDLIVPGDIDKARLEHPDKPIICANYCPPRWKQVWPFLAKGATSMTSSNMLRLGLRRLSGVRQTEARQAASWRRAIPFRSADFDRAGLPYKTTSGTVSTVVPCNQPYDMADPTEPRKFFPRTYASHAIIQIWSGWPGGPEGQPRFR